MTVRMSEAYDDTIKKPPGAKGRRARALSKIAQEKYVTTQQDSQIEWSNLIFLPFHPVFRMFILCSVFIKAILGPIQSVYPIVYCKDWMDRHPVLGFIKYCYWYACDSLYGIDTFLHIVHRQVADKAMRREHLPKSAILLMCDLMSLIPFFRLLESNPCPPARLWPNILAFNEFIVIYRVTQYFSLVSTHSFWKLLIGFTVVLCMCVNCVTCFWLLLTQEGFCNDCTDPANYYDWRANVYLKLNETDERFTTYVYGAAFVLSSTLNIILDGIKPSTILEYGIVCIFLVGGYMLTNFLVIPKMFSESTLTLRTICNKYPAVKKVIEETKRRNPSKSAPLKVEQYYKQMWRKRNCIVTVPQFFLGMPRYLRLEIKQDLLWPLYHHSPSLRKTSYPLQRWLSESVVISYKFPGEKLFTSVDSHATLFFLQSGIVQLISDDDGTTPILSVTSGTIFGDINFLIPHMNRKTVVRCVTYCEIYCVTRESIIKGLHKYPADQKIVMKAARNRIEHAKILFSNKKLIRGLDRNEDEGIAWIKTRWWELFHIIHNWTRMNNTTIENAKIHLPHETKIYHCPKYIGQLVLCTPTQLQTKSMFTQLKFPWILNPQSYFGYVWNRIITVDVMLVLFLYPPNLIKTEIPDWFIFLSFWSDTIYLMDLGVSLFTAVRKQDGVTSTFSAVLSERFKSFTFMLDILSTFWFEEIFYIMGATQYYNTLQFNRLIKVYILFYGDYIKWDVRKDPVVNLVREIILLNVAVTFIISNALFEVSRFMPTISFRYFFGENLCTHTDREDCSPVNPLTGVSILWSFERSFSEFLPEKLIDIYVASVLCYMYYILHTYFKGRIIAYLYLKKKKIVKYQNFVSHIKSYYENYKMHHDLLKRLDRYLTCHWKYYKGTDVLYPNRLDEEADEIFMKAQGEVAKRIIYESPAFRHADPALINDLAYEGKFLLLPKLATIILFGMPCKNVTWIVQGFAKCEYHNENGELLTKYYGPGSMLSVSAVFFGKEALRTYSSHTDSEILYIQVKDFMEIYKRHNIEYSYLENCLKEFEHMFDDMFKNCVIKHRDYQLKLKDKNMSIRTSMIPTSRGIGVGHESRSLPFEGTFCGHPESGFMQSWMLFRAIVVCISIASATLLGGVGAKFRWMFMMISAFCDCIALIDIAIKLFLAYHDERGILITNKRKCAVNYLTKAFILDLIGALPLIEVLKTILSQHLEDDTSFLINSVCKFAHVYIVFAYFDYISDAPTMNSYVVIIKWQIMNILIVMVASHYFMVNCVHFQFNDQLTLVDVVQRNTCWMPKFFRMPTNLTEDHLHLIFAQSLNLAECGMMRMNFGRFWIDREHYGVGFVLFTLGLTFWFISCYTLTLLVLEGQGHTVFQHGVFQLQRFLTSERVNKKLIKKVMEHFRYCWIRTKGANIEQLTNDRVSLMFRQDLNYNLYRKTFTILDSLLGGGDTMQRHLACASNGAHFLPDHNIFKEMDLVTTVCIVHRGRVNIFKDGKKIIILTKGDIFGQLRGTKIRPIRVTATADDYVDLLFIDIPAFQSIINDHVRLNIAKNPQTRNDFMATKTLHIENPYDTIKYLLRGRKTIMLPWSKFPTEARHGTWYSRWLYLAWFIGPFLSFIFVVLFSTLPPHSEYKFTLYFILIILDFMQLINFIADFYTIELIVHNKKVVPRRLGLKKFKDWGLYLEVLTLLLPLLSVVFNSWRFHLARILRLKLFYDFDVHFCRGFKSKLAPIMLKLAILVLLLHSFTCGWIHFACRDNEFPIHNPDMRYMNITIDFSQWAHPDDRQWGGCARVTRNIPDGFGGRAPAFVVPRYWPHDYVVAMTYILLIHTHTSMDITIAISLKQVYYKVFITFCMYLLDMWIMALALNFAYTQYSERYQYDFHVQTMMTYLTNCGLCKDLKDKVLEYTSLLWNRQRGDWLPELVYQVPPSLRHEIFCALYIHHLESAPTLRTLPLYFKRQLAARLQRIVVFPGKCIVREGDVFNTVYFIHEGEVEKWYNTPSGHNQLLSVLYTNGYFGCVAGFLINAAFQFSYYARTVVDLVVLNLANWTDLLAGYPEIKNALLESTKKMKTELFKEQFGKSLSISIPTELDNADDELKLFGKSLSISIPTELDNADDELKL